MGQDLAWVEYGRLRSEMLHEARALKAAKSPVRDGNSAGDRGLKKRNTFQAIPHGVLSL